MTTKWKPDGLFTGQTVAVIAGGPSATLAAVAGVRQHKRIAINDAYLLAPDADLLFAHDLSWWQAHPEAQDFSGLKVSGQEGDIDALFLPMPDEIIGALQVRNSGLMAIRIAAMAEAAHIMLVGFDPELEPERYPGLAAGLDTLITELVGKGIEVTRVREPIPAMFRPFTFAP